MHEMRSDQATGLRRLLTRDVMRVVAFAAGCRGAGGTTAVVNIAAALAAVGRQVLAIDEDGGAAGVAGSLGIRSHLELRHAARRECALEDVLVLSQCGISVLPAGQPTHALPALRHFEEPRLLEAFTRLGERFDMAFIDSRERRYSGLLSRMVTDVVLVASANASAVTGAYSLIKRSAAQHEYKRFHILVNDVATASVAQLVFGNLERAARDYLDLPLANLGWVPRDGAVQAAAARKQPVVTAVPAAPSAIGFGRAAASMASWPGCRAENPAPGIMPPRLSGGVSRLAHASI